MKNRKRSFRPGMFSESLITQKYAAGDVLLVVIAVLLFLVSFFSGRVISSQYRSATDDLLELNNLFVAVENTNQAVYDYNLYLSPISGETYTQEREKTRRILEEILRHMDQSYSREVTDLCYIVDSYLDKSDLLIESISQFRSAGSSGDRGELVEAYLETQQLIAYINQNFQEVYINKLETTQQMQHRIEWIQTILSVLQIAMLVLAMAVSTFFYQRVVRGMSQSVNKLIDFASGITKNLTFREHIHIDTGDELTEFYNNRGNPNAGNCFKEENMAIFAYHAWR